MRGTNSDGGGAGEVRKRAPKYLSAIIGWTMALRQVALAARVMMWSLEEVCMA